MVERILIIDDDVRLAEMLIRYLSARGLTAEYAEDAASGLALVARGGFDAVVLDVMLPDLDGFEVCRRLRADSEIPILNPLGRAGRPGRRSRRSRRAARRSR